MYDLNVLEPCLPLGQAAFLKTVPFPIRTEFANDQKWMGVVLNPATHLQ
jgi:hypothetical protein